jgi:hypothetical protein
MGKLKDLKEEAGALKDKIVALLGQDFSTATAQDAADMYNDYWPTVKEVLQFAIDRKITGKKADKKLQSAVDAGDKIYAVTSDPVAFAAATGKLSDLLNEIDEKIDKIIAVLTVIGKFFRDGTKFDEVIDKTIEFLGKVSDILEKLEEKL